MPDRIRLDGRVAVVTGAAGVIGTATIRLLAERGARIVAVDRRQDDLKTAINDLPASAEALAVAADVTKEDEVAEYVRATVDRFGTIDAFYNNAGIEGDIKPIPEYSLESFRRVLDVNVVGVFLGMKHVLPVMLKQNKGSIINTASIAGLMGSPMIAVYSASKHAGDRADQERGLGMHRHRRSRQLRLPRPDRQPDARARFCRAAIPATSRRRTTGSSTDSGAPAWTSVRGRLHRGVPRLRRGELRLRLRLHRRWRPHRRLSFIHTTRSLPVCPSLSIPMPPPSTRPFRMPAVPLMRRCPRRKRANITGPPARS